MKKRDDIIKITIDSPAAAGAGTQAKLIGKHYNLLVLDTGRCYRYVAYTKITEPSKYNYEVLKKKYEGQKILSSKILHYQILLKNLICIQMSQVLL